MLTLFFVDTLLGKKFLLFSSFPVLKSLIFPEGMIRGGKSKGRKKCVRLCQSEFSQFIGMALLSLFKLFHTFFKATLKRKPALLR